MYQRKKWLQEALSSFQGRDPVKVMVDHMNTIINTESTLEEREDAFEELLAYVEDLDLANDFHKVGGYVLFESYLKHKHASMRAHTAELAAILSQNNPYNQQYLVQSSILPDLLSMVDDAEEEDLVRVKALYAVSCLVRNNLAVLEHFIMLDGFSAILRAMQSTVDKLTVKASFLLSSLCIEEKLVFEPIVNVGLVEQIISTLQQDHAPFHEHLLRTLCTLTEEPSVRERCKKPDLKLQRALTQRTSQLRGKEEHQESVEFCQTLLDRCFTAKENAADR